MICDKEGIPPEQQRLSYSGVMLNEGDSLNSCRTYRKNQVVRVEIQDGTVFHMTLKLSGGGPGILPFKFNSMGEPI